VIRKVIRRLPDRDDWLGDLRILHCPTFAVLDSKILTWVSFDQRVISIFESIIFDFNLPVPKEDSLVDFFLGHATLMLVIDGHFGRPKGKQKCQFLDTRSKRLLQQFAKAEDIELNDKALHQLLVSLSAEFIYGFEGLIPDIDVTAKLSFLRFAFAALPKYPKSFPEKSLLTNFVEKLCPKLEMASLPVRCPHLINELNNLLYGNKKRQTRARLMPDMIENGEEVEQACDRFIERHDYYKQISQGDIPGYLAGLPETTANSGSNVVPISDSLRLHLKLLKSGLGKYTIEKLLGSGKMGNIYEAIDPDEQTVAIKVLHPRWASQTEELTRFGREIEINMALKHPNIVTTYEYGTYDQSIFFVMELLPGGDLEERLDREKVIAEQELWTIVRQIAQGLDYGWNQAKKFVHRDLKPSNILFSAEGVAKISDFGMAAGASPDATRLTIEGEIVGTPVYMSPEQVRGAEPDIRSDLWALGVIAFRSLSGRYPFFSQSLMELSKKILRDPPEDQQELLSSFSSFSQKTIDKLLRKNPEHRFQSPRELLAHLEEERFSLITSEATESQKQRFDLCMQLSNDHRVFLLAGNKLNVQFDDSELSLSPVQAEEQTVNYELQAAPAVEISIDSSNNGVRINEELLSAGQRSLIKSDDWIHVSDALSLKLSSLPGALLLTRKDQNKTAYLWLYQPFSLFSLSQLDSAWPLLQGTLVRDSQSFYYIPVEKLLIDEQWVNPGTPLRLMPSSDFITSQRSFKINAVAPAINIFKL
jgi:serine/threonine protein kinase